MKRNSIAIIVLSSLVVSTLATADSLEEQKARKAQQKEMDDEMKDLNKSCGTSIALSVDWDSWAGKIDAGAPKKTSIICFKPVWVLQQMCSDKDAKAAIQKEVTQLVCRGGGGDQATVVLDGAKLVYTGAIDQKKAADVKAYLMKTLK
jgi:hypothetical protein